jgi:hypothetical protein
VGAQFRQNEQPGEAPLREVLNDWEEMLVAKHAPGMFNVPYVAGMNKSTAHTGILKSAFDLGQAYAAETQIKEDIGTRKYLCAFYCPVLSAMYGTAAPGLGVGTKLGGLNIVQTDNPSLALLGFGDFNLNNGEAYSMSDMYGS